MEIQSICSTPEGYRALYKKPTGPMYRDIVCWAVIEHLLPNPTGEPLRRTRREVHGMVFMNQHGPDDGALHCAAVDKDFVCYVRYPHVGEETEEDAYQA
jgi:hypothetical protein